MSSEVDAANPAFESLGNNGHYAALASSLLFALVVVRNVNDPDDRFFDDAWKEDGFCVKNLDVPYWSSHDACLYFDTAAAIVLAGVYFALRSTPGMKAANDLFAPAVFGIFAHGVGHGLAGKGLRDGSYDSDPENLYTATLQQESVLQMIQLQVPLWFFWAGLVKASTPQLANLSVTAICVCAWLGQLFMPKKFGFTYVQTVLILAFSINQLARKKEEKQHITYATYPLVVVLPTVFVGWIESTQCSAFVKEKFYGHLVYDAMIPISTLFWYLICHVYVTSQPDYDDGRVATPTVKKDKDI